MKEITQGVDNINFAVDSYKKNRIQVSNTKKPLFFYVILAKVSYAATLHSLLISDESYRPIIGSKRHILYSLLLIITVANVPSRSIKDALKALFGIALYQLNQASLVGFGVVPALVSLIVRDASTGIVEDATAVLAQIAGCKESEEAMRKASGFRVLCDLLDEWTGASGRIRENAVAALLNLAWCGGENGRKEVREMRAKVMEGITEVAENGSAKGKNKAVELLKFIVDRNGNGNEEKAIQEQNTMLAKQIKERQKRVAQQLQWGQQDHSLNTSSFVLPQPHPCLNIGGTYQEAEATESEGHRQILTKELEAVGLRLNKRPPQIYFKKKKTGGISFNSTLPLTHVNEKLCYQILHEYKIHNAEVLFREDATVDDLIDVIEGNRKYIKCVYVYNKIDVIGIDDVDKLAQQPNSVVISCNLKLNLDRLLSKMWDEMGLVRVYTKPQGQQPDFTDPVVLSADRGGCTVEDFCNHIHRSLIKDVKYVLAWGTSARHFPQHCGLGHVLQDEDVVQIVKKKETDEGGRGRFKSHSTAPARISDREKKAPLKN